MASLPPRPKTPPILPDERRLPIDDRDRDRRSAQPMAPPGRFRDRHLDGDRPYHPPPRRLDTYVPGGYDRRDPDRRDYDSRNRPRDYDRDRDRDRDCRLPPRDRDFSRSPRRRSPDRDRRQYDRDRPPYRRGPSPFRRPGPGPPRRDSRSPPRRRYSPSPPPRSKYRSRSRSPRRLSPLPYRRVRLGNHSIEPSSRPRSPYRRPHSRDRSLSPNKPTGNVESPHCREPEHIETKPSLPSSSTTKDAMEVVPVEVKPESKLEQQNSEPSSSDVKPTVESPATVEAGEIGAEEIQNTNIEMKKESEHMQVDVLEELPAPQIVTPSAMPPLVLEPHIIAATVPVPERKIEPDEKKMDIVEPSPTKPLPTAPASSQARRTSPRSPRHYDQRTIPTGPQRNRRTPPPSRPRSPPRAPRNHPRPITTQNSSSSSYPPRELRRNFQPEPAFSSPVSAKVDHDLRLPKIPKYQAPRYMAELELELAKHPHKTCYTPQYLQQMKGLQRALHELDMATIDLQAAEARRLVAKSQLEKAKIGCLGIDAKETVDVA